jgi:8-oxo-dGTP pyrophosphatase MutT (NUDIX family)
VARLRSATATSAGGVVSRRNGGRIEIVVGRRRRDHDSTWTLPKGTPNPGESTEETAVREVTEETGLDVRIVRFLDSIHYSFVQRRTRIDKTVHYYLMEPAGGDLSRHDREFEEVRWVALDDAPAVLTFPTERALAEKALAALADEPVA